MRSRSRANHHPTVKPLELMRHLVRLVTPPGRLVLDPFLGSGTTAIAAQEEGFRCIGIEKEPEYMAIAEARLNGRQVGLGLEGIAIARLLMRAAVRLWPPERHADGCDCALHRAYRLGDSRGYHRCSKEAARREDARSRA